MRCLIKLSYLLIFAMVLTFSACGTSTTNASDSGSVDSRVPGADVAAKADVGAKADAENLPLNDAGCLTYEGATTLCGDGSSGTICAFSVQCGTSTSASQCGINCSMGAGYSKCYAAKDVLCLQNTMKAQDCTAFSACGWIL
jgi:hypothetical protein